VKLLVAPANAPAAWDGSSSQLGFRWRTLYLAPNGAKEATVKLQFDDDFRINTAAGGGNCTPADVAGKNIAQAYAACGPGGKNAYLSKQVPLAPTLSGRASTAPPGNFGGCTMVFKGPTANQVLLYMRFTTTANSNPNCTAPATNTGGNTTFVLTGTLGFTTAPGYARTLTIPNINSLPLILDDFYATIKRGTYFQARCANGGPPTTPWILRGDFTYTPPQAGNGWPDVADPTVPDPGTTEACS
jgi:hypothetical protein